MTTVVSLTEFDVAKPAFDRWAWRAGNAFVGLLARAGIGPIHLLTTRDRRTGRPHTNPVVPVEYDGRSWLVAPYGTVSWVCNAREAGLVRIRYGRSTREYTVREVDAEEAGAVLKRYVTIATKTRRSSERQRTRQSKTSLPRPLVIPCSNSPQFPSLIHPPGGTSSWLQATRPARSRTPEEARIRNVS